MKLKSLLTLFTAISLFFSIAHAQTHILLKNNIKKNIDTLAYQLSFLTPNYQKNENQIKNLLKLYFENYKNIVAFEIKKDKTYLYSSYKKNERMILIKNTSLNNIFNKTKQFYKLDIKNEQNKEKYELIVYFKENIHFTKEELKYLQNKKILLVQNDSNLPPYNFNENGLPKGFSIDYMNLIANKLAIEVKYIQGNWDNFLNMLENNELDLMLNVLKSKEREEKFLFTQKPYASSELAMLTRIEHKDVHSFKELEGETMALVKGYHSYDRVEKDYPKINIYPTTNTYSMIEAVATKKADASYGLKTVLEYNINKHLFTNLKTMKNIDDKKLSFYITVNKENRVLKSIIEKAQKQITKKELEELKKKWFKIAKINEIKSKNFLFTKKEISYLNQKKHINMCVDPNYLPYEYIDEKGNFIGIIANFINQLSKNSGINFNLIETSSWSESLNYLQKGLCDITPNTVETENREEHFIFTQSYFEFSNVIATKENEIFIDSIENIKDKKIGVIKNHYLAELLKSRYPNLNLVEMNNTLEGLKKIKSDEIYAFIDSFPSITYNLQNERINDIKISGKIEFSSKSKIAIRKDELILQSILNKAINSVSPNEKEALLNRWLTIIKEEKFNTDLLIKIVSYITAIALIIIILVIYRSNRKLSILNKKLEKASQTDKLTSIYNRAKLDMLLDMEFKNKKRYKKPLSLILADIDYFKKINDTYGHLIGDKILIEFSQILQKNIRETDFLGRWGGEEFLIIIPFSNEEEAMIQAEHLRNKIQNHLFTHNIKITASFGVYEVKNIPINKALSNVDKALYSAKKANRNCVKVYKEE